MIGKRLFFVVLVTLILVSIISCSKDKNIPNVSNINVSFNINRFEQKLFDADQNSPSSTIIQLQKEYPIFSELYFTRIVPLTNQYSIGDTSIVNNVVVMLKEPHYQHLADTIQQIFGDFSDLKTDFEEAFQFYKHYFPERDIPDLYTFLSGYAYQNFIFNTGQKDGLGIGLDMFLGAEYPYRKLMPENPSFSQYLTRSFNKDHLVKKTLDALIDDIVGNPSGERLIDQMIHNGKKLYLQDHLLPHVHDTIKLEYTADQDNWINENEIDMWAYFLDKELFYSTDRKKIRKLIDPSPKGASDMPPEAPGRTANWVGWKIVEAYMKRMPNMTMQQLVDQKDAQMILDKSKYKPKRR